MDGPEATISELGIRVGTVAQAALAEFEGKLGGGWQHSVSDCPISFAWTLTGIRHRKQSLFCYVIAQRAHWSPHRNQEPQFPLLLSTTTRVR